MMTRRTLFLLLAAALSTSMASAQSGSSVMDMEVEVTDGVYEDVSSLRQHRRELYSFGTFSFSSLLCECAKWSLGLDRISPSLRYGKQLTLCFCFSLIVSSLFAHVRCRSHVSKQGSPAPNQPLLSRLPELQ